MEKNNPEQEQKVYNQKIRKKENQMDDLANEKRKIESVLSELEADLHRGFRQLSELNEEQARYGNTQNLWELRKNEEQSHIIQQKLQESNEQIALAYKKETKVLDDERETLYKKRSEISWD
ncbi:hypothetical protein [Enterococcus termitis]|nr:hypothetical protein [Enterococcus termitis]OJG98870.1 hypothetical protein RV18_GL002732 [Enterococcus termitis]